MEKVLFTDPENGETVEFFVLEETQLNGVKYLFVTDEEEGDADAYILKELRSEDEEVVYEMVEDDVELSAVGKIFSELMDEDTKLEF